MALAWEIQDNNIATPVGSDIGPSLTVYDGRVYAAWKGCTGDTVMWYSTFDGHSWGPQARISNGLSDIGPSLAVFRGALYAEWKGSGGDQRLWYSSFDGSSWTGQKGASGESSIGSSMVAFRGVLFSAYKAHHALEDIYYATFDGASWARDIKTDFQTSARPSVAVIGKGSQQRLFMAWKGNGMDERIWYSIFDGSRWTPPEVIPPPAATNDAPSLAVLHEVVYIAWRAEDDKIWFSAYDGRAWASPTHVQGPTPGSYGPSLVAFNNQLFAAWKGRDTRTWWTRTTQGDRRDLAEITPGIQALGRDPAVPEFSRVSQMGYSFNSPPERTSHNDMPYGAPQSGNTYNPPYPPPPRNTYNQPYGSPPENAYSQPYTPPPGNVYGGGPGGSGYSAPFVGDTSYGPPPVPPHPATDIHSMTPPVEAQGVSDRLFNSPPETASYAPYMTYPPKTPGGFVPETTDSTHYSSSNMPYGTAPTTSISYPRPPGPPPDSPVFVPQYQQRDMGGPVVEQHFAPESGHPIQPGPRSGHEDWENKLSWAQPNPASLADFHYYHETPPTIDWNVLAAIVNKPNTPLAVISYDSAQENVNIKLCTLSAEILWQKSDLMPQNIEEIAIPAFSEDGTNLVVHFQDRLEVIDARRGTMIDLISLTPFQVSTVAIGRNPRNLVVSSPKEDNNTRLERIVFSQAEGSRPVHIISTSDLSDVSIAYSARDRRIIAVGKGRGSSSAARRFFMFCWDANSRVLQYRNAIAGEDSHVDAPLQCISWADEHSVVFRLRHSDPSQRNSLHVLSVDGQDMGQYRGDRMLHTVSVGKVLVTTKDKQLQLWTDNTEPTEVGTIVWDGMPPIQEIKGFAVSEWQMTMVLDDGQFIFLRRN